MALRIPWDHSEALILLDALIRTLNGELPRKEAISLVSKELRQRAVEKGIAIDPIFRNKNGITLQMSVMEYLFTDGVHGLKKLVMPKLFIEVIALYKEDRCTYEKLLKEAKNMSSQPVDVQNDYFTWLSTQVSPSQLSDIYDVYAVIEEFCLVHKILHKPLFQTVDISTLVQVRNTVESNQVFRFKHKRQLAKMSSAVRFYITYIKEQPFSIKASEVLNLEKTSYDVYTVTNKSKPVAAVATVETKDIIMTVDLSEERNYTFATPISFSYFDEVTTASTWKSIYIESCKLLFEDYPNVFEKLKSHSIVEQGHVDVADNHDSAIMDSPLQVADELFLETNLSATDLMCRLRRIIELCNMDYDNLQITYTKKGTDTTDEVSTKTPDIIAFATPDDVHVNRVQFIDWMREQDVSTATVFSYLFAIGKCTKAVQQLGVASVNLLTISNVDRLISIKTALFSDPEFKASDTQQHNCFLASINKLIAFRTATAAPCDSMGNEREFEQHNTIARVSTDKLGLDQETHSRYTTILAKYFGEDGYQPGRAIFRGRFRKYYQEEFGTTPQEGDDRIDGIMDQIGTNLDGRIFPKPGEDQTGLISDIIADIMTAFAEGATGVYTDAVFTKYQQQLADRLQIYHVDALVPLLLSNANGRYYQKYSYLTPTEKNADPAADVLRVMKSFAEPQDYESIHEKLWYIPYDKMKTLLVLDKSIVNVAAGTYFYAPNIPISADELRTLIATMQQELNYHSYITDVELMELIRNKCPSVAINTANYTTFGLRNCLGYILRDHFSFNGPIISALGSELRMADVYAEFARSHEVLQYDDLKALSDDMNIVIYWDSVLSEMVRVSESEMVRNDRIHFDVEAIDNILDNMCPRDYVALKDINLFLYFPNIGYPWNSFVLESYLFGFSRKFKLFHTSFGSTNACGAMVRANSIITDYRSLVIDILAHSNALHSSKEALQYLVSQGYQQRKILSGIEQIVQEAKLLKEQIQSREK